MHLERAHPVRVIGMPDNEPGSRIAAIVATATAAGRKIDMSLVGAFTLWMGFIGPMLVGAFLMSTQFDEARHRSDVVIEENRKAIASARATLAKLDELQRVLDREAAESVGWSTDGG